MNAWLYKRSVVNPNADSYNESRLNAKTISTITCTTNAALKYWNALEWCSASLSINFSVPNSIKYVNTEMVISSKKPRLAYCANVNVSLAILVTPPKKYVACSAINMMKRALTEPKRIEVSMCPIGLRGAVAAPFTDDSLEKEYPSAPQARANTTMITAGCSGEGMYMLKNEDITLWNTGSAPANNPANSTMTGAVIKTPRIICFDLLSTDLVDGNRIDVTVSSNEIRYQSGSPTIFK